MDAYNAIIKAMFHWILQADLLDDAQFQTAKHMMRATRYENFHL